MTAKMVIASAERLIDVRHFWRKRKRIAEMSVPAWPIPTQNTKFVMSQAQPTGTFRPQIPIPSQKSHETATPRRPRSARAGRKKNHQPIGVRRSTTSATTSVIAWKSGERRMRVGLPATGLSSSSASVWAKPVPPIQSVKGGRVSEEWRLYLPSRIAGVKRPPSRGATTWPRRSLGVGGSASRARSGARRRERGREADLPEQRLDLISRSGQTREDPRGVLADPCVCLGKRAHRAIRAEEPLPCLVCLGRELLE